MFYSKTTELLPILKIMINIVITHIGLITITLSKDIKNNIIRNFKSNGNITNKMEFV